MKFSGIFAALVGATALYVSWPVGPGSPVVAESLPAGTLTPMPEPTFKVGEQWHYRDQDGVEDFWTVTSVDQDGFTSRLSDGCTATTPAVFSPSVRWSGCGGADATQTVTPEGSIWPLAPAQFGSFHYLGEDDSGQTWSGQRICAVLGETRVTVPAGEFDTFHVMCDDPWKQRHWYLSPTLRRGVLYHDVHKQRHTLSRYELVKFVPGK